MTAVDSVRVEVAFTTTPDDAAPAYQDISSYVDLSGSGINITRYRQDEFSTVQPGTCSITLQNDDGRFTADNAASPYFPNLKLRKKVRVSYRDQTVAGNMLTVEDSTFEGGTTGAWVPGGSVPPTLSNSAVNVHSGTKAMLITWGAGGSLPLASLTVNGLTIGRTYTVSMWVFVPVGSPNVLIDAGGTFGAASAVTGSFTRISATFTATLATGTTIQVWPASVPAAGNQCWVDDVQLDEGSSVRTFTSTAPAISYRFTGYADEWPTEWPTGSVNSSNAVLLAVDRLKRLGTLNNLRSVIEQEYLNDNPYAYYTLGEPAASVLVGDTSKNGRDSLGITQLGVGGTLTLGTATGPSTDALTALSLAPASTTSGKYLSGTLTTSSSALATGQTLECFFLTSTAAVQTIVLAASGLGAGALQLSITAAGKLQADTFGGVSVVSAATVSDGALHHAAVSHSISAGTVTLTLYLDGVSAGTNTFASSLLIPFGALSVGGSAGGTVFNGTIAHVALYDSALALGRISDHSTSGRTGFSGERSDQRIARIARWVGIPTAEQSLDTGLSTSIAFVDTTDQAPVQAMRDIEATESGILAINGAGQLLFHARSHRYNSVSAQTLTGDDVDPSARFISNDAYLLNDVTASRTGGITFRATNTQSNLDYGPARTTVALLTTSDNEVVDAANWKANQNATPSSRLPSLMVDIIDNPTIATAILARELSDRITVSSLPTQAPASSIDLFIEGWTENITVNGWSFVFNTSPANTSSVWQLDSATYSQLDTTTRLAY